jgi:tetratricopeptide (TPR) repeat protein
LDRIETFRRWLVDKPGDRFAMYSLALELKKAGRFDEALEAFGALLAAHPTSGAGHYQLGELFREQGDEARAAAAWRVGLEALRGAQDPEARRSISEIQAALDLLD